MAATVESRTATVGADTNPTSWAVDMPATVNSGDKLVMNVNIGDGGATANTPSGWTKLEDQAATYAHSLLFVKAADGTEGGTTVTITQTGSVASNFSAHVYRLSSAGTIESAVATATGSSMTPPSISPSWGSADTLYLLFMNSGDDDQATTSASANYTTNLLDSAAGQGANDSARVASSYRNVTNATETPGTWTIASSEDLVSFIVAVQESAGGSINIDSVSNSNAGEIGTMEVTGDSLTGAASVAVGFNNVDLAITVVDLDTLTYTMPDDGQAFGGSYNFDINVDGVTDTFSATFNPPTGKQYKTLTADYGSLDADSFLVEAGLSGLVTGDQILLDSLDDQGGTVTLDPATGLVSSTTSSTVDWTFEYAIVDASDTYALGTASDWTVYSDTVTMAADTSATPNEGTTAVGTYVATNTSNPDLVYSLSGTDAADFNINSSTGAVTAKVAYDYETKSSYSITVTGTIPGIDSDSQNITINVQDVNESPTDISLSSTTVSVAAGTNAPVGVASVTDPDSGDSHTITLVAGTGDTDNASFSIHADGQTVLCNDPAALGVSSRSILLQADDGVSTPFTKAFTINVVAASTLTQSTGIRISLGIAI